MTDAPPGHGAGGVAVGAGLAGAKVAQDLRDRGYAITGADALVVLTLRSRFDSNHVRAVLEADQRIVIVGDSGRSSPTCTVAAESICAPHWPTSDASQRPSQCKSSTLRSPPWRN